ncbi:MAG: TPM domain-containing protein, partial [bacterium]
MKKLFLLLIFILLCSPIFAADDLPNHVGWVNDFAGILDAGTKAKLTAIIDSLEKKNGAEIAVVTVKEVGENYTPKDFATALFKKWGIGKKGVDSGVLFLVSIGDRRVEIETGYGVEGVLTDGKSGEILDTYVVPYFKKNDYPGGILAGVDAIVALLAPVD